jgi:predicted DNA-binding transcriptional regulator AlpA
MSTSPKTSRSHDERRDQAPLLTPYEVAVFLGVPLRTIYRWRSRGDGPRGYRIGRTFVTGLTTSNAGSKITATRRDARAAYWEPQRCCEALCWAHNGLSVRLVSVTIVELQEEHMARVRRRFGSLRQLPSGRWQDRYRDRAGRFQTAPVTFARKSDAARHLALVEVDTERGEWTNLRLGRSTFAEGTTIGSPRRCTFGPLLVPVTSPRFARMSPGIRRPADRPNRTGRRPPPHR